MVACATQDDAGSTAAENADRGGALASAASGGDLHATGTWVKGRQVQVQLVTERRQGTGQRLANSDAE
jgi:hypothetical protein